MESSIVEFYQDIDIPTIHKLVFHPPHVRNIETHHCVNTRRETFKRCSDFQDVLCRSDYAEHVITIFAHQI